jgi:hypothetical protein
MRAEMARGRHRNKMESDGRKKNGVQEAAYSILSQVLRMAGKHRRLTSPVSSLVINEIENK